MTDGNQMSKSTIKRILAGVALVALAVGMLLLVQHGHASPYCVSLQQPPVCD
jgi:hypothetical protein